MRLLFVHERFGAMAGAEVNAWLTATELKSRGHHVGLLHGPSTGRGEPAWRDLFAERFSLGAPAACRPFLQSLRTLAGRLPALPGNFSATQAALDAFQPDAVYVHKMPDAAVLEALVQSGLPVVRMVHDHDLYCMRSYKYSPFTRRICTRATGLHCVVPCGATFARNRQGGLPVKWVSYLAKKKELRLNRKFQRMVVATDYMKDELLRNGFDARRIEIHAPVPRSNGSAPSGSFSDRNLIVYSGQIIRGKGVDVLLESLACVRRPFECVILGDGSHRSHCERLSRKLGLADRVRFTGYLPPDELQPYYADASLAVMSSLWPEPFGAAGLEAMRFGLPVIAFDAGGIREWLIDGQNGFLVPWQDCGQFAAHVDQLLGDKRLARELGRRGQVLVHEKFNFEQYISGLEAMFERVISETELRTMSV